MSRTRPGRRPIAAATAALVAAALLSVVPPGPAALADPVWGPEEDLGVDVDVFNYDREPAVVGVRGDGTAVAAWVAGDDTTPGPVTVSHRAAGGGWTMPLAISADLPHGATYALDVAGGGLASVVWEREVGGVWRIEESHLDGGTWTAPVRVGSGQDPETVVDGTGVTTVAWRNHGLRAARRTETGAWSAPRLVAAGSVDDLALATNADGDVAAAWTTGHRKVRAAVRPHGKSWASATILGRGPYVTSLRVAMGGGGRALVIWTVTDIWDEAAHEYQNYLAWARSDARGHWSRARVLTRRLSEDGGAADLSMNGTGRALATWLQIYRSDSPAYLWAARFRPDGTWSKPVRVGRVAWSEPEAWLDRNGAAHVAADRRAVWHFSQAPGAGWQEEKINRGRFVTTGGAGERWVVLYRRTTLRSRTLDVD
jgi:hypothetical protein